jgi:2-polyprenyl-6-methoxyphenol hydroxylase-like FAD-dependent oxidoreductase
MMVANEGDDAVVTSSAGEEWGADVVVGAEGVHSTVRRFVDPDLPTPRTPASCCGGPWSLRSW